MATMWSGTASQQVDSFGPSVPASSAVSPAASVRSSSSSVSSVSSAPSATFQKRMSVSRRLPAVDTSEIETAMMMAALDTLKGYGNVHYSAVRQPIKKKYVAQPGELKGYDVLREPSANKGTSFTPEERLERHLTGLVPHTLENLAVQCARAMRVINTRTTPIDKYMYLTSLKANNHDLFYRLLIDNITELMPLVYTPTIGDVCLQYSTLYTRPEALYISIKQRKSIRTILRNWPYPNPSIAVVTDGSRILGLGDLGMNGVGISVGKLALYIGAAGVHPEQTLPIVLDCGTNNQENLRDPLYLGLRQPRVPRPDADQFMQEFMEAVHDVFPEMLVQFEDFETEKAFNYLDKYRNYHRSFNDDIQGTGAVVLSGYMGAAALSGVPVEDQRVVFMGAGSAGVGVAKQLLEYYTRRGLSEQQAKEKFYLVDTTGLVTRDRPGTLPDHKKYFARTDNNGHQFRTLEEVIEYVKPSALIGLTATFGVFTESIVRALKLSVEAGGPGRRPILFPLSNPLTKAECTFQQAVQWTDGTVIFASGSPFAAVQHNGVTYQPNQGNNVYIFPGLGLGAILAKATSVTDEMVYSSSAALAGCLNSKEIHEGRIYPELSRVREASVVVARETMKAARREGVSALPEAQWEEWEEWGDVCVDQWIRSQVYDPKDGPSVQALNGHVGLWQPSL